VCRSIDTADDAASTAVMTNGKIACMYSTYDYAWTGKNHTYAMYLSKGAML